MRVREKDIYKKVALKMELPADAVESVGRIILGSLRTNISRPEDISYELRHIGVFNIKHSRFIEMQEYYLKKIESGEWELDTPEREAEHLRRNKVTAKIKQFKETKTKKREERYEYQANQKSQGESEEY